jgi:hypothetical protein
LTEINNYQKHLYGEYTQSVRTHTSMDTVTKREIVEWGFFRDHEILRVSKSFKLTVEWAIKNKLIPESRNCKHCHSPVRIYKSNKSVNDGHLYYCTNNHCKKKSSIKGGTIFQYSCLTFMEITRVIFHFFVRNINATQCHAELREIMNPNSFHAYETRGPAHVNLPTDIYKIYYQKVQGLYQIIRY